MLRFLASGHLRYVAVLGLTATICFYGTRLLAQETTAEESEVTTGKNPLAFISEGGVPTSIEQLQMMEEMVAEVSARAKKATVNIEMERAQGSGVVISDDGYILTAAHVIGNPNRTATITFADGTKVKAVTLGSNRQYDSGMLKIVEEGDWPYLDIGESETLKRGQWVLALGHPGGLKKDRGIVVRIGRILTMMSSTLRTDCTLVGGDSGGPLIDFDGNVIGIHSRIGGDLSQNMHVPIDVYSEEWDDLETAGDRPRLGLDLVGSTNEIKSVSKDEPASKAGLEADDKIIKFNDADIKNRQDLRDALKNAKAGDTVTVKVLRDKEEKEFEVELGYFYKPSK